MGGIHPILFLCLAVITVCLLGAVAAFGTRTRNGIRWGAAMLLVACLPAGFLLTVYHPEIVDPRVRHYKRFYRSLSLGMSRTEVETEFARFYPDQGRRKPPHRYETTSDSLGLLMNTEGAREPNAEAISLTFRNGRLAAKQYLPD